VVVELFFTKTFYVYYQADIPSLLPSCYFAVLDRFYLELFYSIAWYPGDCCQFLFSFDRWKVCAV